MKGQRWLSCGPRGGENSGVVHAILYLLHVQDIYVEYGTACATSASSVYKLGGSVRGVRKTVAVAARRQGRENLDT